MVQRIPRTLSGSGLVDPIRVLHGEVAFALHPPSPFLVPLHTTLLNVASRISCFGDLVSALELWLRSVGIEDEVLDTQCLALMVLHVVQKKFNVGALAPKSSARAVDDLPPVVWPNLPRDQLRAGLRAIPCVRCTISPLTFASSTSLQRLDRMSAGDLLLAFFRYVGGPRTAM